MWTNDDCILELSTHYDKKVSCYSEYNPYTVWSDAGTTPSWVA